MQIWETSRIREWDHYTITNEPVSSLQLMERAAEACLQWLLTQGYGDRTFTIFCGKGNNGGDGLALARLLAQRSLKVSVWIMEFGNLGTDDFQSNLVRLHETSAQIGFISDAAALHPVSPESVIIDALVGTGLNKPLEGLSAMVAEHINQSGNEVISIDIPSGLFAEQSSLNQSVVRATHTLSFQCYKLAFLLPENETFVGQVHILDIGLHPDFIKLHTQEFRFIDQSLIKTVYRERSLFAHKGKQGHAALWTGSAGMMGAAVLAAKACLRAGVGKLTCIVPQSGLEIMQVAIPESLCALEEGFEKSVLPRLHDFTAVGAGPGIGRTAERAARLRIILENVTGKLLLDADALNLLAADPESLSKLPALTILTPHIGEWERLGGRSANDVDRIKHVRTFSRTHNCIVVLKGRYTFIASPDRGAFFNTTGNNGLAKAGTGDVLTGMITSYLAQGYAPLSAAQLGVFLHGYAADRAIETLNTEALLASDVIDALGKIDFKSM